MPIYEYECKYCNEKYELFLPVEHKIPYCQKCGRKMKKLISLSNFKLVGNGWYETDYKHNQKDKIDEDKTDNTTDSEM